ncbi:MAG: hypothetical protein EOO16_14190 [Chitinophagaceae bacterium]|nr:MAG: hypothetical protein EOO16_14190 [Chitinophagaceae bacterium]
MKLIIFIISIPICTDASSQHTIGIGPSLAIPANFTVKGRLGFGASLDYTYQLGKQSGLTVLAGYSYFPNESPVPAKGLFYVRAGYKHSFVRRLSLSAEAGYGDAIYIGDNIDIHYPGLSFGSTMSYNLPVGAKRMIRPHVRLGFIQLHGRYVSDFWFQTFDIGFTYGFSFGRRTYSPNQ